jgi:hypothetical protein
MLRVAAASMRVKREAMRSLMPCLGGEIGGQV